MFSLTMVEFVDTDRSSEGFLQGPLSLVQCIKDYETLAPLPSEISSIEVVIYATT